VSAHWEHFPHGADVGIRGFGGTKAEAFEQAALAMMAVVVDVSTVAPREAHSFECEAPDDELLFVEWLNALIYVMDTQHLMFSRFAVVLEGSRLHGRAWGEALDLERHHPAVEIKGATYTMLRVTHQGTSWVAQTVLDV